MNDALTYHWISTTEDLPLLNTDVLVFVEMPCLPSGELDIAFLDSDGDWNPRTYWGPIRYWMYLPESP